MNITVSGKNIDVTPALRATVEEHLEKIKRHLNGHITQAHVVLHVEKGEHYAEGTLHVHGTQLAAQAHHDDMYTAIHHLADKLDRQALKFKEKMQDHKGSGEE